MITTRELLEGLRWKADQVVTNHDGERVWLREVIVANRQIGITDCCLATAPCEYHAQFGAPAPARPS